jgi:hypothetical protein
MLYQSSAFFHSRAGQRVKRYITGLILPLALLAGLSSCYNALTVSEYETDYVHWYIQSENSYTPSEWQECLTTLEQLTSLGITFPERFKSLADAKHIVEQLVKLNTGAIDPVKPVTVALYPEYDWNGVFTIKYNSLTNIINHPGQQLLYFEIGSDLELKATLRLLKEKLPANQKLAVIIAGHGDRYLLQWGGTLMADCLDPSDYQDRAFTDLLHSLNISIAVFESCEAGKGGSKEQNQANRLAEHIRTGGKVIAPLVDVNRETYLFSADGGIEDALYNTGDPAIVYRAAGKLK